MSDFKNNGYKTVRLSCLIEPQRNWVNAISLLVNSLKINGGKFKDSAITLLVISKGEPDIVLYKDSTITVITVNRITSFPTLNKISLFKHQVNEEYNMILDHDIIILSLEKLDDYLNNYLYASKNLKTSLRKVFGKKYVKIANELSENTWQKQHYFNAGVLVVPTKHMQNILSSWEPIVNVFTREYDMPALVGKVPFCNLSLSLAIAKAKVPNRVLPDLFNQRNWKKLPKNPSILHYNNYDPVNINLKNNILYSLKDFEIFLNQTNNIYWKKYQKHIIQLLTDDVYKLALKLEKVISILPEYKFYSGI